MDEAHVPTSWLRGVDADVYSQRRDPLGTLWRRIVDTAVSLHHEARH